MSERLNPDTFIEYVLENDEIDVREVSTENQSICVENIADTDPLHVAEMFVIASDCQMRVGPFSTEDSNGTVRFYP